MSTLVLFCVQLQVMVLPATWNMLYKRNFAQAMQGAHVEPGAQQSVRAAACAVLSRAAAVAERPEEAELHACQLAHYVAALLCMAAVLLAACSEAAAACAAADAASRVLRYLLVNAEKIGMSPADAAKLHAACAHVAHLQALLVAQAGSAHAHSQSPVRLPAVLGRAAKNLASGHAGVQDPWGVQGIGALSCWGDILVQGVHVRAADDAAENDGLIEMVGRVSQGPVRHRMLMCIAEASAAAGAVALRDAALQALTE